LKLAIIYFITAYFNFYLLINVELSESRTDTTCNRTQPFDRWQHCESATLWCAVKKPPVWPAPSSSSAVAATV